MIICPSKAEWHEGKCLRVVFFAIIIIVIIIIIILFNL